jgi:hypothetical protein
VTFWYGSESGYADPYLRLTDSDPDPGILVSDLQDDNSKLFFVLSFVAYYFLKLHLHNYSKIKSHKEVTKHV